MYKGSLINKGGKLGNSEKCCCDCCVKCYSFDCAQLGAAAPGDRAFKKTITIPANFSLPAKVRINGAVDDVLLKDDQPWPPGTLPNSPAYAINNFEWLEDNRTFTLEVVDTQGANIGLTIDICITCRGYDFTGPPCDTEVEDLGCD